MPLLTFALLARGLGESFEAHAQSDAAGALSTRADRRAPGLIWTGSYQVELGGESFTEMRDQGVAALLKFKSRFDLTFAPWLKARIEPKLSLFSSRLQSRFSGDQYESAISAKNAYLSVRPIDHVELRAGALSQDFLDNPNLVSKTRAFPGLQEILRAEPLAGMRAELIAEQVVPTSTTLNPERSDVEPLPILQTQGVQVRGENVDGLVYRARAGHYAWSRLPDKVAFESAIMGNTVPGGEVAAGSRFLYGFDGFYWGGDAEIGTGRLRGLVEYRGLRNRAAASDSADAQAWGIGPKLNWRDQIISFKYGQYFVESDATVARYNSADFGHNNRVGDVLELRWAFPTRHFALRGQYVNARAINPQFTQGPLSVISLGVETDYASF